jgi:hypothetical protein
MSAIATLSTKCSGLLLRSSFAILAARARHLHSDDSLFGSVQVVKVIKHIRSDCFGAAPLRPVGRLWNAPGSN